MVEGWVCILIAGLLWTVIGIIISQVARHGHGMLSFLAAGAVLNAAASWILLPRYGVLAKGAIAEMGRLAVVMFLAGAGSAVGTLLAGHAMRQGHHGATWTMVQSAMVIPFLAGVFIWRDRVGLPDVAALVLILTSIVLFGRAGTAVASDRGGAEGGTQRPGGAETPSRLAVRQVSWWVVALAAFVFVGLQQVLHTMPSRWPGWDDTGRLRVPLAMAGTLVAFGAALLFRRKLPDRRSWIPAALLAVCVVPSHVLLYRGLDALATSGRAGLGYPVAVGTCVIAFATYSVGVLREPTTREHVTGLVLGIAGVVLMAM
jgi:multidrug transporter EmrE-like cation transporter